MFFLIVVILFPFSLQSSFLRLPVSNFPRYQRQNYHDVWFKQASDNYQTQQLKIPVIEIPQLSEMPYSETPVVQQMIAIEPMKQDVHEPMSSEEEKDGRDEKMNNAEDEGNSMKNETEKPVLLADLVPKKDKQLLQVFEIILPHIIEKIGLPPISIPQLKMFHSFYGDYESNMEHFLPQIYQPLLMTEEKTEMSEKEEMEESPKKMQEEMKKEVKNDNRFKYHRSEKDEVSDMMKEEKTVKAKMKDCDKGLDEGSKKEVMAILLGVLGDQIELLKKIIRSSSYIEYEDEKAEEKEEKEEMSDDGMMKEEKEKTEMEEEKSETYGTDLIDIQDFYKIFGKSGMKDDENEEMKDDEMESEMNEKVKMKHSKEKPKRKSKMMKKMDSEEPKYMEEMKPKMMPYKKKAEMEEMDDMMKPYMKAMQEMMEPKPKKMPYLKNMYGMEMKGMEDMEEMKEKEDEKKMKKSYKKMKEMEEMDGSDESSKSSGESSEEEMTTKKPSMYVYVPKKDDKENENAHRIYQNKLLEKIVERLEKMQQMEEMNQKKKEAARKKKAELAQRSLLSLPFVRKLRGKRSIRQLKNLCRLEPVHIDLDYY